MIKNTKESKNKIKEIFYINGGLL